MLPCIQKEKPWFLEARKDRNSKYHDFYIWKEGTKEQPPEGGGAFFGGSTWEWVPEVQEYYYHSFSVMQPDLNWKNPSLRKELYRMIQFWMDKGIRGFRLDAIDNIVKDGHGGNDTHSEQIHTYLMEMNQNTYGKSEQILTVGETGGATVEMAQQYSDPESQELSMIFQFELMGIDGIRSGNWDPKPYTLPQLKQLFEKWQTGLEEKGWNSLFWGNHDFPRVVSRFGNDREPYREKSAKMLAVLLHGMKGTPYIYRQRECLQDADQMAVHHQVLHPAVHHLHRARYQQTELRFLSLTKTPEAIPLMIQLQKQLRKKQVSKFR